MNVLLLITPKCNVEYLEESFSIRQTLEKMDYHHYSAIPLLSEKGEYIGVVSEGDLLWFMKKHDDFSLFESEKVSIMDVPRRHDYTYARSDTTIEELYQIILSQNFVPIIDDRNMFIGIITRKDIIGFLYKQAYLKKDSI